MNSWECAESNTDQTSGILAPLATRGTLAGMDNRNAKDNWLSYFAVFSSLYFLVVAAPVTYIGSFRAETDRLLDNITICVILPGHFIVSDGSVAEILLVSTLVWGFVLTLVFAFGRRHLPTKFSIRAMLIVTGIVALVLGLTVWVVNQ
jgi:hypothetical protein